MKLQEVKYLLEKYYNAESDLSEENQLREFLTSQDVPDDMQESKDQFIFFSQLAEERPIAPNLEKKIMASILNDTPTIPIQKKKPAPIIGRIITSIAAGILLIFIVKSIDDSFNNGLQADKLTTSINSAACKNLQTCYENAHDALSLMSEAIQMNDELISKKISGGLFGFQDSKTGFHSIIIDDDKFSQLLATSKLNLSKNFRNIASNLEYIKISHSDKESIDSQSLDLAKEFNSLISGDNTFEICSQANNQYKVFIIDYDKTQKLMMYHSAGDKDLLIEINGKIKISDIREYSISNLQ